MRCPPSHHRALSWPSYATLQHLAIQTAAPAHPRRRGPGAGPLPHTLAAPKGREIKLAARAGRGSAAAPRWELNAGRWERTGRRSPPCAGVRGGSERGGWVCERTRAYCCRYHDPRCTLRLRETTRPLSGARERDGRINTRGARHARRVRAHEPWVRAWPPPPAACSSVWVCVQDAAAGGHSSQALGAPPARRSGRPRKHRRLRRWPRSSRERRTRGLPGSRARALDTAQARLLPGGAREGPWLPALRRGASGVRREPIDDAVDELRLLPGDRLALALEEFLRDEGINEHDCDIRSRQTEGTAVGPGGRVRALLLVMCLSRAPADALPRRPRDGPRGGGLAVEGERARM